MKSTMECYRYTKRTDPRKKKKKKERKRNREGNSDQNSNIPDQRNDRR